MLRGNKVNKIITSKPKRKRGLRPDRSLPSIQIIKRDPPAGIKELWVQSIEKKGVFVIRDPPPRCRLTPLCKAQKLDESSRFFTRLLMTQHRLIPRFRVNWATAPGAAAYAAVGGGVVICSRVRCSDISLFRKALFGAV